jgi:8-oxo-dGTP pyrophosphatase MutT (NUDIX family)
MAREPLVTCGIYLFDKNTGKILICHAAKASWKTWSIPKGLQDKDESFYDAAVRELKEETGIDAAELHIVFTAVLKPVKYKKQNKLLMSFLMITDTPLKDHICHCETITRQGYAEVDGWAWIKPEELLQRVHESQQENYPMISKMLGSSKSSDENAA